MSDTISFEPELSATHVLVSCGLVNGKPIAYIRLYSHPGGGQLVDLLYAGEQLSLTETRQLVGDVRWRKAYGERMTVCWFAEVDGVTWERMAENS